VRITGEDTEHQSVCWSPDGSRLAFVSARHEGRLGDLRADAWTCKPDGSDVVRATDGTLTVEQVAFSTDGTRLWLLASDPGPDGLDFVARHTGLWSVPVDGSAAPVRCTDAESLDLGEWDTHLTPVPHGVLVQVRNRGAVDLLFATDDGEPPRTLVDGHRWVLGHDAVLTEQGLSVVATVASDRTCGELVAVLPGPERVLTDFSGPLRETAGIRPMRELTVTADDGVPVHGWVVLPDGPGPHPVLLNIHGGPFMQHGWSLNDEAQLLAAHGYAVLQANPRGSAGYGEEFGRVIQGAMGQRDAADLLDFLEGALADPELHLDDSRVGVLGISYGGYMTAWLTTHPRSVDRFAAAVVESGFLDPVSFAGTADIGWFFGEAYTGTAPEQVAAQSPMAAVDRVRTPTLVIHSEQDYRCPLEQGQRWFAGLLRNGVDTEFLVFPGESHLLTLDGRPRHRRQRFDHLLRWWGSRLPVDGARPAGTGEE
jgi:dipeptidyl aminopeptidase/acylaminoacyl peptidase